MKQSFDFVCPNCNNESEVFIRNIGVLHWNRSKLRRANGWETTCSAVYSFQCPNCNACTSINFVLNEYPDNLAESQVISYGNKVIETTDFSSLLGITDSKPQVTIEADLQKFRLGYFDKLLDTLVRTRAMKMVDNYFKHFPKVVLQRNIVNHPVAEDKQSFPAALVCCINSTSRKCKYGVSGKHNPIYTSVLKEALTKLGGIGNKSDKNTCNYPIGNCAEVNAASKVLKLQICPLYELYFSVAVRPRTMQVIYPCQNCSSIFINV